MRPVFQRDGQSSQRDCGLPPGYYLDPATGWRQSAWQRKSSLPKTLGWRRKSRYHQYGSDATDDPLYAGIATTTANDPLYAKALILRSDHTTVVLVTVDAVAIGEIGTIGNDYLTNVRAQLQKELANRSGACSDQRQPLPRCGLQRCRSADGPGRRSRMAAYGAGNSRRRHRPRGPDHGKPPAQTQKWP